MINRKEILNILQDFKSKNKSKYSLLRIGIFGSAAKDKVNEQSDVDVVVELEKQDLFYLTGIKQDLEERIFCKVDVVSYREEMNKFLKEKIDKEAIYV
ncbi:nucleotidyltransferase domain-containing protein [bacterium]|nr:nucleotidyltransferase domain-containing protein [bacterium]